MHGPFKEFEPSIDDRWDLSHWIDFWRRPSLFSIEAIASERLEIK
jgi:hypothetical protein